MSLKIALKIVICERGHSPFWPMNTRLVTKGAPRAKTVLLLQREEL